MNWGTKLIIGMILFMAFIVTLVTLMIKPHKADSLIETDYYEKGQTFDRDYNAGRDAIEDKMIPLIKTDHKGVVILFPAPVNYTVFLRNLADSDQDKIFKSDSSRNELLIPGKDLKPGSWLLRIDYKAGSKEYFYQDKILLP